MNGRLSPESRTAALAAMAAEPLDVLVIGGGVVGAGAALDAASRGLTVGLVEMRDWASGTSSASSKLVHGGLRYLEMFDLGLVHEALTERDLLLDRLAPHLVRRVPFLYPLHSHAWERAYVGAVRRPGVCSRAPPGAAGAPAPEPADRGPAGPLAEVPGPQFFLRAQLAWPIARRPRSPDVILCNSQDSLRVSRGRTCHRDAHEASPGGGQMRKAVIGLVGISLAAGLVGAGGPASASPPDTGPPAKKASTASKHDLPSPLADKQRALRQEAIQRVLTGQSKVETINGVKVVKLGKKPAGLSPAERAQVRRGQRPRARMVDQYVRLDLEQTDRVFVILTEFGNERHPSFPDKDIDPTTPGPRTFEGPLHNAIPQPNRAVDNSTIWQPDYSAAHFRQLYFGTGRGNESLKQYYQRQSSGRYTITGQVTDWVKVRYNEARYGRSNDNPTDANGDDPAVCSGTVCSSTWNLLTDGMNQWVADQKAAGRTDAQIKAGLASYDRQDRYDYDGDGNFVEPDGYLDRFQIVHSGGDQADGDPYQGEDAIWSHRWYAYYTQAGATGPAFNKLGGTQIANTGLWVGDYTVNPENGGRSVIAHEYGHDLGLPDHYDTAGGGDNGVDWWTLMAQSRARARNDVGIGTRAADLGVWDKLQLQWLDHETAIAGQRRTYRMGPHEYNSRKPQALVVVLPDKEVSRDVGAPASGTKQWWSGTGDDLNATLTRSVTLPAGSSTLSFQAKYDIEVGYDYAVVEVNDGTGWKSVRTSISNSQILANGIEGTAAAYQPATADMSAYAGKTVQLRFRYFTDGGVAGNDDNPNNNGFFVDDIALRAGSTVVFSDGAESGNNGWTPDGFSIVGASIVDLYDHFYLASYRAYVSYDRYLRTGPYNFGFPATPDRVEFFPYQNGLLVNYYDTSQTDNNKSQHQGQGLVLPIDANPAPIYNIEGRPWRGRIQVYDAPFSRERSDSFTLHINGKPSYIRGRAAQPLFDDSRSYYRQSLVDARVNVGVKVPNAGVTLRVVRQGKTSMTVRLGTNRQVSAAATLQSARSGN